MTLVSSGVASEYDMPRRLHIREAFASVIGVVITQVSLGVEAASVRLSLAANVTTTETAMPHMERILHARRNALLANTTALSILFGIEVISEPIVQVTRSPGSNPGGVVLPEIDQALRSAATVQQGASTAGEIFAGTALIALFLGAWLCVFHFRRRESKRTGRHFLEMSGSSQPRLDVDREGLEDGGVQVLEDATRSPDTICPDHLGLVSVNPSNTLAGVAPSQKRAQRAKSLLQPRARVGNVDPTDPAADCSTSAAAHSDSGIRRGVLLEGRTRAATHSERNSQAKKLLVVDKAGGLNTEIL
jgi:hypothetical protein